MNQLRVALASLLLATSASAETIAVKVGHLVDPANGTVMDNRIVLIDGKKIVDVVERMPSPAPATVIDLSTSWVSPGLMDLHTHLSYDYSGTLCANYVEHGNGYRALMGMRRAEDMLAAGFTTVRDLGNAGNYVDTDLRKAIEAGLFVGPTIVNAGKIIAPFGAQQDSAPVEVGPCWHYEYIDADGVDEVRKAVRTNIFYGARVIKLVSDPRGQTHGIYTEEEIRVAAEETHRVGLTLAVHAKEDLTAIPAILGGADSIEHGYTVSDATLKLMKQRGVYLVSTDRPISHVPLLNLPNPAAAEASARAKVERLRRAYKIGVPLAFGTDVTEDLGGRDRGRMTLDFIQGWIDAGIPSDYIVKAMTTNAARVMKLEAERGSIAKGQYADLIATAANPLADARALAAVTFVMKDGKPVPRRTLSAALFE
ncbi:amidohydrolase family protein [Peristeroidobacter soli]|uniref:amidohydrolase family protein n=1 Tax=Peristeroidobacter soli TaxID=2497877 RepID=UPI00101CCBE8|nr:amidohydrolase family protein [Peristeroidobacter soli]